MLHHHINIQVMHTRELGKNCSVLLTVVILSGAKEVPSDTYWEVEKGCSRYGGGVGYATLVFLSP